jgi:hypothetical protein
MTRDDAAEVELCRQCGHPFDDHAMVPTTEDELAGGVILCPAKDCQCFATWAVTAAQPRQLYIPDDATVARIRAIIQANPPPP